METTKKPIPPSDDIDLMRYVSLFLSNWLWIGASLFLALAIAYIFNHYSQRMFTVRGTLMIKEQQSTGAIANMEQIFAGAAYNPYPNLEDEVAILTSYTLNRRVIEDLIEHHVAYIPVKRNGIQGQRTYKESPFILQKMAEEQPVNRPFTIRFTGPDTYTVSPQEKPDGRSGKGESEREFKVGELYNLYGFNFTVVPRDSASRISDGQRWLVWFESPDQ